MKRKEFMLAGIGLISTLIPAEASDEFVFSKKEHIEYFYSETEVVKLIELTCNSSSTSKVIKNISVTLDVPTNKYRVSSMDTVVFTSKNKKYNYSEETFTPEVFKETLSRQKLEINEGDFALITRALNALNKNLDLSKQTFSPKELDKVKTYFKPKVFKAVVPVERRNGSVDYISRYILNIPSDIMNMVSQIEYRPETDEIVLTSSFSTINQRTPLYKKTIDGIIFTSADEKIINVLESGNAINSFREYIFIKRAVKYLKSFSKKD